MIFPMIFYRTSELEARLAQQETLRFESAAAHANSEAVAAHRHEQAIAAADEKTSEALSRAAKLQATFTFIGKSLGKLFK